MSSARPPRISLSAAEYLLIWPNRERTHAGDRIPVNGGGPDRRKGLVSLSRRVSCRHQIAVGRPAIRVGLDQVHQTPLVLER